MGINDSKYIRIGKYPSLLDDFYPLGYESVIKEKPGQKFLLKEKDNKFYMKLDSWLDIYIKFQKFGITKDIFPIIIFQIKILHHDYWPFKKRHEKERKLLYGQSFKELKTLSIVYNKVKNKEVTLTKIRINYSSKDQKKNKNPLLTITAPYSLNRFLDFMDSFNEKHHMLSELEHRNNQFFQLQRTVIIKRDKLVVDAFECLEYYMVNHIGLKLSTNKLACILGWICSFAEILDSEAEYESDISEHSNYDKITIQSFYTPYEEYLKTQITNIRRGI